jgi:putative intracellular protease/amidase
MAPKILVVLTSVDKMPKTDNPTGWYLPEFAHPYEVLAPKADIVVASPKGGVAPVDPASVKMFEADKVAQDFLNNHKDIYSNTTPLREFLGRAGEFDALFYPGGHGPMYDLVDDKESIQLIQEFWAAGKIVSAVCHGPAALLKVDVDGQRLVKGRQVTGFTDAEEDQVQLSSVMPFLLETELRKAGADFAKADAPWGEKVLVDGKLITGQNPASGKAVGEAIAKALGI